MPSRKCWTFVRDFRISMFPLFGFMGGDDGRYWSAGWSVRGCHASRGTLSGVTGARILPFLPFSELP